MSSNVNYWLQNKLLQLEQLRISDLLQDVNKKRDYKNYVNELLTSLKGDDVYQYYPHFLQWAIAELREYQNILHQIEDPNLLPIAKEEIKSVVENVEKGFETQTNNQVVTCFHQVARKAARGEYWNKYDIRDDLYQVAPASLRLAAASESALIAIPNRFKLQNYEQISEIFSKVFDEIPPPIARHEPIFWDLLERHFNKINVALVLRKQGLELKKCIIEPLEVFTDPNEEQKEIEFEPKLEDGSFRQSVYTARAVAYQFLIENGCKLRYKDFKVKIRFVSEDTFYEEQSAGLGIALAIVAQVIGLRLDSMVVVTGVLEENGMVLSINNQEIIRDLETKLIASDKRDEIEKVITPRARIPSPSYRLKKVWPPVQVTTFKEAVERYFEHQWNKWLDEQNHIHFPEYYVPRDALLEQLADKLEVERLLVIEGLIGTGKTFLLKGLRDKLNKLQMPHQCLIEIKDKDFTPCYSQLARFFDRYGESALFDAIQIGGYASQEKAEIVCDTLKNREFLILFDEFEKILDFEGTREIVDDDCRTLIELLATADIGNSRVLIATNGEIALDALEGKTKKIQGFSPDEAKLFLKHHGINQQQDVEDLIDVTDGHPAALRLIVALKQKLPEVGFKVFIEDWKATYINGKSMSYKRILQAILETLDEEDRRALYHFSVYQQPVTYDGIKALKIRPDSLLLQSMPIFLVEQEGNLYYQPSVVGDYAYYQLELDKSAYHEVHRLAGGYYQKKGDYLSFCEALYHYREADYKQGVYYLEPLTFDSLGTLGYYHLRLKHYPTAERYFRKLIDLFGEDGCRSQTLSDLAYCLAKQKRNEEAERLYRKAAEKGDISSYGRLAMLLLQRNKEGDKEDAWEYFQKAYAAKYDFGEMYVIFAEYMRLQGRLKDAKSIVQYGIAALGSKTYDGLYCELGLIFKAEGKYEEACNAFEQGLVRKPSSVVIYKEYITLLVEQRDFLKLREVIAKSFKHIHEPQVAMQAGKLLMEQSDLSEAINIMGLARQFFEKDERVYSLLAKIYRESEQLTEAIRLLTEAIPVVREPGCLYIELGIIYWDAGNIDEVVEILDAGLQHVPDCEWLLYFTAAIYRITQDWDNAINILEAARTKFPHDRNIYYLLGKVYLQAGNVSKAMEVSKEGVKRTQETSYDAMMIALCYTIMAEAYLEAGDRSKALEMCDMGIEICSSHSRSYLTKAMIYEKEDEIEQAIVILENYFSFREPGICPDIIKALIEEKGIEAAMNSIAAGTEEISKTSSLPVYLAVLYVKIGNSERALQVLNLA